MKNKLTFALLFAGLFLSGNAYADNCEALAGQEISFLNFETECPFTSTIDVSGDKCIIERKARSGQAEFICTLAGGTWTGGPWQYTGAKQVETPDPEVPSGIKYPESTFVPFESSANASTASNNAGSAISDFSQKMAVSVNTLALNQSVLRSEAQENKHQIMDVMGQYNTQTFNRDTNLRDRVMSLNDSVVSSFDAVELSLDEKFTENKELHEKTHEAQTASQESLDSIKELIEYNIPKLDSTLNQAYFVGELADGAKQASIQTNQQLSTFSGQAMSLLNVLDQTSLDSRSSLWQLSSDVYDLKYQIAEISDMLQDDNPPPSCGGMMEPPCEPCGGMLGPDCPPDGSDNGGSFSSLDSQNLQSVADSSLETVQAVRSVDRGIDNVENSLDDLLTELTSIKDALENGSSEYDDTEVNQKLTELINNTGTTGTNVVTSGQATQQAVSASGQQVTEAVNGLGDKLDGIGEGIDSLSDSLKPGTGKNASPTLCTGDDCYKGKSWVTPKYPEGISSIYEDHKTKFQDSSIHEYMKGFVPDLSGSAPDHWEFCINFDGMANLGCHTVELPPYVISFVRLIILISAGFLCRRLIFGG